MSRIVCAVVRRAFVLPARTWLARTWLARTWLARTWLARTCIGLLCIGLIWNGLLWSDAGSAAEPSEASREAGTGGLLFVNDGSIQIESQDLSIGRDAIKVTYGLRNAAAVERSVLVSFPSPVARMRSAQAHCLL